MEAGKGPRDHIIIGIHPDRKGSQSYSEKWTELIEERGAIARRVNLLALDWLDQVLECDGIMWRWSLELDEKLPARRILYVIEHYLHKPVFPDTLTSWHYDDKLAQYYLFQALGVPTPNTWVFWHYDEAVKWAQSARYPLVCKLAVGASSSEVVKVENQLEAVELIERAFQAGIFPGNLAKRSVHVTIPALGESIRQIVGRIRSGIRYVWSSEYPPLGHWWLPERGYVYFQEFISGNEFDTRVIVIGDYAWACRRFNRPNDFRASGSGLVDFSPDQIEDIFIRMAFQIAQKAGLSSVAFDFLKKDERPVVTEISYTFSQKPPWRDFPGYWTPDIKFHEGTLWPEQVQVEMFLKRVGDYKRARGTVPL